MKLSVMKVTSIFPTTKLNWLTPLQYLYLRNRLLSCSLYRAIIYSLTFIVFGNDIFPCGVVCITKNKLVVVI